MTGPDRITAFPPVAAPDARILILGSMPSVASLDQGFYYGHPRNAFWRIMAEVYRAPLPETIGEKRALLIGHGIALWDVLDSCVREGSLDSAIRAPRLNDFGELFERCPGIRRVLLNGGTAARLFRRADRQQIGNRVCLLMPSTSPAYTIPYERKLALWRQALVENYEPM